MLPLEFLLSASKPTLQSFELARRNHAANLRKELRQLEDELRELEAEALFARWLIDHRADVVELCRIDALQLRLLPEAPPNEPQIIGRHAVNGGIVNQVVEADLYRHPAHRFRQNAKGA